MLWMKNLMMHLGTFRHIPESLTNYLGMKLAGKSYVILKALWDPALLKFIALNIFIVVRTNTHRKKYRRCSQIINPKKAPNYSTLR